MLRPFPLPAANRPANSTGSTNGASAAREVSTADITEHSLSLASTWRRVFAGALDLLPVAAVFAVLIAALQLLPLPSSPDYDKWRAWTELPENFEANVPERFVGIHTFRGSIGSMILGLAIMISASYHIRT